MSKPPLVLVTGATGNMGREVLRCLRDDVGGFRIRLLIQPQERSSKPVAELIRQSGAEVVWGDLERYEDVLAGVAGADFVLHVGGLVSPLADRFPELTRRVNVGGARNIVDAIRAQREPDRIRLVYIGTVAQTGSRMPPIHWGRTGDPIKISRFDHYAVTKTQAEAIVAESGLRHWVSLRQTGIAHTGLWKIFDPIMFHNPINGVFEWVTARDSGRLLGNLCRAELPDSFWRSFYNIGGGVRCRVVNHEFMRELAQAVPFYVKAVGRLAPALIRKRIRDLAEASGGSLHWFAHDETTEIAAFFGSREQWHAIPDWPAFDFAAPSQTPSLLDHGFDEQKPKEDWTLADYREAERFRGGNCLSRNVKGPYAQLDWTCALGHTFRMSPNLMLAGGHWCPTCMIDADAYPHVAARSPFFRQVWQGA